MKKIKLSTWLLMLTIMQFMYVCMLGLGVINPFYFDNRWTVDINHEDLVFILHFMTYFIVKAIEDSKAINIHKGLEK